MKIESTYICEWCGTKYKTQSEAEECESQPEPKQKFKLGEIVFEMAGYGWHDGLRTWVKNPTVNLHGHKNHGNCFRDCCTYRFYYVVTGIKRNDLFKGEHAWRYHITTRAMTGKWGHREKWVNSDYITNIRKPPADVLASAKAMRRKKVAAH